MPFDETRLLAERDKHQAWISSQPGVSGVGIGLDRGGNPALKILTNHMSPATQNQIRSKLEGVPVDFEETGEFSAF